MRRVYQGGDFLKEAGEFATPCDEMAVERFIAEEEVFLRTPHLHEKDLEQAFFCCNARGVCSQDSRAQASKPVQLYESKETHREQQDDKRGLCQDNTPENGQTHSPLLGPSTNRITVVNRSKHFTIKNCIPTTVLAPISGLQADAGLDHLTRPHTMPQGHP